MGRRARLLNLARDSIRARAGGVDAIVARRERRLAELLAHARTVPLYRRHWAGAPDGAGLSDLPPVTKSQWVAGFDDSVTDPSVRRDALWTHMRNLSRVGAPWRGRYSVCRSSGTSGQKSLFVADQDAMDVYWTLWLTRGWLPWLGAGGVLRLARRGGRVVSLIATGGHYASAAMIRRPSPIGRIADSRSATLSILKPVSRLARALERWRPAALVGYPTMLEQLARLQSEGRLSLDLALVVSVSEWVDPMARRRVEEAFGCPLRDSYALSEFLALGFECRERWLHLNEDWAILEPVDDEMRPVPAGEVSHTALVTNLANRVQPVVRHDVGDRVTVRPDPCPCGSPFRAVRVEGRRNDVLEFGKEGSKIRILPMALITLVGGVPGIEAGSQFVQTAEETLSIRLACLPDADPEAVWREVARRVHSHLAQQGLAHVAVVRSPSPPRRDEKTGKLRRFWSETQELPARSPSA